MFATPIQISNCGHNCLLQHFANTSSAGLRLILCAQVFFKHYICSVTMNTKLVINVQVLNLIIIGLFIDAGLSSS